MSGRDEAVRLVVQGDDFGMCHAINEGVLRAFHEGILTQASTMAPCPWFPEAASLAKAYGIPVGMHGTLTCEWDHMRWQPLTRRPSLCEADGTFHRSIDRARLAVETADAVAELSAQARHMAEATVPPLYVDWHMGLVSVEAYAEVCEEIARPFLHEEVERHLHFDSFAILSEMPPDAKRDWLLAHLERLSPGTHYLQTHPAVASPELRALTAPGSSIEAWGEPYRTSDLAAITDPEVTALVRERGIRLVDASQL